MFHLHMEQSDNEINTQGAFAFWGQDQHTREKGKIRSKRQYHMVWKLLIQEQDDSKKTFDKRNSIICRRILSEVRRKHFSTN